MDLEVVWSEQGLQLHLPDGTMLLKTVTQVHVSTPQGRVTFGPQGQVVAEQPVPPAAAAVVPEAPVEQKRAPERRPAAPSLPVSVTAPATSLFDPVAPGGRITDYAAFVMALPEIRLPIRLGTVLLLLQTRTALRADAVSLEELGEELRRDPRFQPVGEILWTLSGFVLDVPYVTGLAELIEETMRRPSTALPISGPDLVAALRASGWSDERAPQSLEFVMSGDRRFRKLPAGWDLGPTPPGETFDPALPGFQPAEYIAFVMAQPDIDLPVQFSALLRHLKTRTAMEIPENPFHDLSAEMAEDPRFFRVSIQRWTLSSRVRIFPARTSTIEYLAYLMQLPDTDLPVSVEHLLELLETRTNFPIRPPKFKSVHSAMSRDARFFRVGLGLWSMNRVPLSPQARLNAQASLNETLQDYLDDHSGLSAEGSEKLPLGAGNLKNWLRPQRPNVDLGTSGAVFDPMVPGGYVGDYVAFVFSGPDVHTLVVHDLKRYLKTRTALEMPEDFDAALRYVLRTDPRFYCLGSRWGMVISEVDPRTHLFHASSVADYALHVMSGPDTELPLELPALIELLLARTRIDAGMCNEATLSSALKDDDRFRQVQEGVWTLCETPMTGEVPGGAVTQEVIDHAADDEAAAQQEGKGPVARPVRRRVGGTPRPVPDVEASPPVFDPALPGGDLGDYVAFVLAHDDVFDALTPNRLLRFLKTRTAIERSDDLPARLLNVLQSDERFSSRGSRWELIPVPDGSGEELFSASTPAEYIIHVMQLPDAGLPIQLPVLIELLRTRTAMPSDICSYSGVRAVLERDARFYRVRWGLWTMSETPLTPEEQAEQAAALKEALEASKAARRGLRPPGEQRQDGEAPR